MQVRLMTTSDTVGVIVVMDVDNEIIGCACRFFNEDKRARTIVCTLAVFIQLNSQLHVKTALAFEPC